MSIKWSSDADAIILPSELKLIVLTGQSSLNNTKELKYNFTCSHLQKKINVTLDGSLLYNNTIMLNFMCILTYDLTYYCNKLSEEVFCYTEQ